MTRNVLSFLGIALLLPAFAAQVKSVARDGRKIDFIECEKCEMLAKWNEPGTHATINLSRLRDGDPSAAELSRRETEMLGRVLEAMAMKPAAVPDGWREVPLANDSDEPRDFNVPLVSLGLSGPVHALDMTGRAVMRDLKDALVARVPPHETRVYRLSPTTRQQEQRQCCSQ